jgi:hypothetical protein
MTERPISAFERNIAIAVLTAIVLAFVGMSHADTQPDRQCVKQAGIERCRRF